MPILSPLPPPYREHWHHTCVQCFTQRGEVRKGYQPLPHHYWTQINVNGIEIIQVLEGGTCCVAEKDGGS